MLSKFLPHLNIVFAFIMLILLVTNKINAGLGVLRGNTFETFFLIFIIVSLLNSAVLIILSNKRKR